MAWNPEEIRATPLYDGDFKLTSVMIMEESAALTEYADYVAQTAASGFRPRFAAITADGIREKVRRHLGVSSKISLQNIQEPGINDTVLWAEAIKDTLLNWRAEMPKQAQAPEAEEITGARSKDTLGDLPPLTLSNRHDKANEEKKKTLTEGDGSKDTASKKGDKKKGKGKGSDDEGKDKKGKKGGKKSKATLEDETDTETDTKSTKKKGKKGKGGDSGDDSDGSGKKKKDKKGGKKSESESESEGGGKGKKGKDKRKKSEDGKKSSKSILTASLPIDTSIKVRHTMLRKRGEPKLPHVQVVDYSPKDGSSLYVLLQGFYKPDLLDALHDVGVRVDGVVLLTRNPVDRRNFGVVDIEENFPGTFQPQNMLPNYLNKIEQKYTEGTDQVSKFWQDLVKKLNRAPPDSYIHDIALLNCELPPERTELHSQEELSLYSIAVLDETAKRIFEMVILQNWHLNYRESTTVNHIMDGDKPEKLNIYKEFLDRIPAECITLPAIMESLLAQVVDEVDKKPDDSRGDAETEQDSQSIQPSERPSELSSVVAPTATKSKRAKLNAAQGEGVRRPPGEGEGPSRMSIKSKKARPRRKSATGVKAETDKKHRHHSKGRRARKTLTNTAITSISSSLLNVASDLAGKIRSAYGLLGEDEEDYFQKPYVFRLPESKNPQKIVMGGFFGRRPEPDVCTPPPATTQFKGPLYIKMHDYASMRTCHLEEELAAVIASTQVFGDFSGIRNFLWDGIPDFNKGLYMKLHSNLTQFMTFLPEEEIKLKDMFFIIHLLLAVAVEIELQKEAQQAALRALEENCDPKSTHFFCDAQAKKLRSLANLYEQPKPVQITDDMELDFSHNYLALAENMDKARILLTPGANDKFDAIPSQLADDSKSGDELKKQRGQSALPIAVSIADTIKDPSQEYSQSMRTSLATDQAQPPPPALQGATTDLTAEAGDDDVAFLLKPSNIKFPSTDQGRQTQPEAHPRFPSTETERIVSKAKMSQVARNSEAAADNVMIDHVNAAAVATANILTNAGEMATDPEKQPAGLDEPKVVDRIRFSKGKSIISGRGGVRDCDPPCDNKWLQDAKDLATLQALVDCPALLAIGEYGNMDVSKWVQTYLFCSGLQRAAGEGPIVGDIKEWAYAEELAPIQMIQALSSAAANYLCMERMYCPFYDTILFIFNDPTPDSLQAESSYLTSLNTVVGLQHFLLYTLTDQEVMDFVIESEKRKGLAPIKTLSVETLMRLIPRHQWVLVPSIKYTLKHRDRQRNQRDRSFGGFYVGSDGEEEEMMGENLDYDLQRAQQGFQGDVKAALTPRTKSRRRQVINLEDGEPRPEVEVGDGDKKATLSTIAASEKKDKNSSKEDKKGGKDKKGKKGKGGSSDDEGGGGDKGKKKGKKEKEGKSKDSKDGKKDKKGKKGKGGGDSDDDTKSGKSDKGGKGRKGTKEEVLKVAAPRRILRDGKLYEELETPLPLLSPTRGSDTDTSIPGDGTRKLPKVTTADDLVRPSRRESKKFKVYDLGKRQLITTSDDYHLFPLDGTVISYNVSTIEPDFRMMQLKVSKNGHESIFYPYYIPHEADLSNDSFVLCPYFHTVLSNGIRFAFHDKRALEDNHYLKYSAVPLYPKTEESTQFSSKQIIFMAQSDIAMLFSKHRAFRTPAAAAASAAAVTDEEEHEADHGLQAHPSKSKSKSRRHSARKLQSEKELKKLDKDKDKKKKKGKKGDEKSKDSNNNDDETEAPPPQPPEEKKQEEDDTVYDGKKDKKKGKKDKEHKGEHKGDHKGKKGKKGKLDRLQSVLPTASSTRIHEEEEEEEEEEEQEEETEETYSKMDMVGQWKYPSSDETDVDERRHQPSTTSFTFGWGEAKQLLKPFIHEFKITLPSGLFVEVTDVPGPPLERQVKQAYLSKGSAFSLVETCRYYTMNGTVVRFLTDGIVQTINARGVTTNIRDVYAVHPPDGLTDDARTDFENSPIAKILNGDIIMPNGDFFHISHGRRLPHDPLFVFTSETMPDGEIFRRRQDGTIYIHRADGCCIVHYPDGTRFTTRMLISPDPDPEFSDWVIVGLKYMVEHPNYCPVIFNTLSGNVHIRLPQGEWARVFAEGGVRIITRDGYKIDVDEYRATMFCPPISSVSDEIPNLTVVKLYHAAEFMAKTETSEGSGGQDAVQSRSSGPGSIPNKNRQEWFGEYDEEEEMFGEDAAPRRKVNFSTEFIPKVKKRQSFAGEATKGLMDANLRPSNIPPNKVASNILGERSDDVIDMLGTTASKAKVSGVGTDQQQPRRSNPPPPSASATENAKKKKLELEAFLLFSDMWTMCKAVDSYDNRFAMDVFGNMIVDKSKCYEERTCKSAAEIIEEISRTFSSQQVPQQQQQQHQYLSGIITAASSEVLISRAQMMNVFKKTISAAENCCKNPKTRIFVVKRDLSGYEFLKESTAERILRKAKSNPDAILVSDPLPNQITRKFFTIMEPIIDLDNPYGVWKNAYREPVFKPRYLCNKDLRPARPDDFRWFAAILVDAHKRRGKSFPSPKDEYLRKKKIDDEARAEAQKLEEERLAKEKAEAEAKAVAAAEEEAAAAAAAAKAAEEELKSKKASRKSKVGKGAARTSTEDSDKKRRKSKLNMKKGKGDDDAGADDARTSADKSKRKSGAPDDKTEEGKSEAEGSEKEEGTATDKSAASESSKGKKKGKKGKEAKGKGGKKKKVAEDESVTSSQPVADVDVAAREETEEATFMDRLFARTSRLDSELLPEEADEQRPKPDLLGYPGDYPSNVADVRGFYGSVDSSAVLPFPHAEPGPPRPALVVRTILEIPRIDDGMQQTLLMASKAYSTAVREQQRKIQDYIVADPRTEEEKQQELLVRKELMEENIQHMHLLQQSAGKLLDLVM